MDGKARTIIGVDFSGAKDAGNRIWISVGRVQDGRLIIYDCFQGKTLDRSGIHRDKMLTALVEWIQNQPKAIIGLDCSLSIPDSFMEEADWETFVSRFPFKYSDPEAFRESCRRKIPGRELKRQTERDTAVPFSAYNIRSYNQTFYGIRDILHPLITRNSSKIFPMQSPDPEKPIIVEVCPASILKGRHLYQSYKHKGERFMRAREVILETILESDMVRFAGDDIKRKILLDDGGDALDGFIAAYGVYGNFVLNDGFDLRYETIHLREGFIYSVDYD